MLKQRILTALVAVLLLLAVIFLTPPPLARLIIAALFVFAAWEWSGFLGLKAAAGKIAFVAGIAALEGGVWWLLPDPRVYTLVLYVAVAWWSTALVWLFLFPTKMPSAVIWVCGALVLLPAYVALDWLYLQSPSLLLSMLLIVWLADIGAYFAGRAFGRVKLAPTISPGKTWEGVIGGLLAVLLAAFAVGTAFQQDLAVLLPFSAAVALLSVVGDLTVSMFKRHSGVKDSGSLFPGHGGILDRIDSVCAAAPLFAGGIAILGLG